MIKIEALTDGRWFYFIPFVVSANILMAIDKKSTHIF